MHQAAGKYAAEAYYRGQRWTEQALPASSPRGERRREGIQVGLVSCKASPDAPETLERRKQGQQKASNGESTDG